MEWNCTYQLPLNFKPAGKNRPCKQRHPDSCGADNSGFFTLDGHGIAQPKKEADFATASFFKFHFVQFIVALQPYSFEA